MYHLRRFHSRRHEPADHNHATTWCGKLKPWQETVKQGKLCEANGHTICEACKAYKNMKPPKLKTKKYTRSHDLYLSN